MATSLLKTQKINLFSYYASIASGLIIEEEKYNQLVEGHSPYWYKIKSQIKAHLLCSGDLSQVHLDALQVVYCNILVIA